MDTSKFASTFAPYTPPPDDPSVLRQVPTSQSSRFSTGKLPWFSSSSGTTYAEASYQSGAVPTFNNYAVGGQGVEEEAATPAQMWETRFGWRVDVCSAVAYLGGPITGMLGYRLNMVSTYRRLDIALIFLILETSNDYVRFHASFIFPSWLQTFLTFIMILMQVGMAIRAFRDASQHGLARYELPYIGVIADRWVRDEYLIFDFQFHHPVACRR
ncbi:hypothetical protein BU17DRAFT_67588 [Hysterangium stoloniferum]|nr:hypothetical protein BU17DRAFT_67588 [Hysterangium stoloniferum]